VAREERAFDRATLPPVRRLLAALDDEGPSPREGDPLPPLFHWLYFLDETPQSRLGPDGHAVLGAFLPPIGNARRLFAGADILFRAPVPIGAALERTRTVTEVTEKSGRSGPLVFVEIREDVRADGTPAIEERRTLVYRRAAVPLPVPGPARPFDPAPAGSWVRDLVPHTVLLFRYSALTFNGHRIHYDQAYATGVEGYPGLVVHGPLMATLLAHMAWRRAARPLRRFTFRAEAPAFANAPLRLLGVPAAPVIRLEARRADGALALSAIAETA
jgi:3-methylfumaryl-CoA hydratase